MSLPVLPDPKRMWRAKYKVVFPYIRNHLFMPAQKVVPDVKPMRFDYSERVKVGLLNPNMEEVRFRMYFRRPDGSRIRRLNQAMRVLGNAAIDYDTGFPRMPQIEEAFKKGKKFSFDEVGWLEIFASGKVSASAYLYTRQEQSDLAWAAALQGHDWHLRKSVIIDERDQTASVDENEVDPVELPFLPTEVLAGKVRIALSVGPLRPDLQPDQTQITFIVRPEQTMRRCAIVAQHKLESTAVDRVINLVLPTASLDGASIELRRDPSFDLVEIIPIQQEDVFALAGHTLYIEWLSG